MTVAPTKASRLEHLRAVIAAHAPTEPPRRPATKSPPIEAILGGEWIDTALGPAFVRDEWFGVSHHHGNLPLAAALTVPDEALSCLAGDGRPAPARFGFFDIETTGLGGGTGTYAFLAGLGTFEDGGFRLRQYFLAGVEGERAMLALLKQDIERCDALVTYNGRAFDVPIVLTRLTLARLGDPYAGLPHFDLLHAFRRLYRHRMPACRLADAERRLLGIERFEDISGALIPSLYFAYIRAGQAAPLRGVFRHNAEDVLSLVGVLARLASLFSCDEPAPDDAVALARWWERTGAPERALPLYRAALPWLTGDHDWSWAAQRFARLLRRAGEHHESAAVLRDLWAKGDEAGGLALAKHLEHRERDFASAAAITHRLLEGAALPAAPLLRRLERLRAKQGRQSG